MNKALTNRQISLILYSIIVGYGVVNIPQSTARVAGTSGWIPLLINTIISILVTYMITYLCYAQEKQEFLEYSTKLVGKVITYIFMLIYILYFFMFYTMLIKIYADTLNTSILSKTPVWSLSLLFFLVVYYALTKGLNTIARICELYGLFSILSFITINTVLFTHGEAVNLRPLIMPESIFTYIKACFKTIFPFLGMEALLFIPINKNSNRKVFKYTTSIVIFIGLLYIYIFESTISVSGVDVITSYKSSLFLVVKGVEIPYLEFFRRLDGIYIVYWTMNIFCSTCLWSYGASSFINQLFTKLQYKHIVLFVTAIGFIVSQIPKKMEIVELLIKYNGYMGLLTAFIIPCILLIITKVKKNDKKVF